MPRVGFEPTIRVFERAKTVHALDRSVTVIEDKGRIFFINVRIVLSDDMASYPRRQSLFFTAYKRRTLTLKAAEKIKTLCSLAPTILNSKREDTQKNSTGILYLGSCGFESCWNTCRQTPRYFTRNTFLFANHATLYTAQLLTAS
jgi:hypothetical protein